MKTTQRLFEIESSGSVMILQVQIDAIRLETAKRLNDYIETLNFDQCTAVVLDLAHVGYFDSSGIGWLLSFSQKVSKAQKKFVVMIQNTDVRNLLKVSKVDSFLKIASDRDSAIEMAQG